MFDDEDVHRRSERMKQDAEVNAQTHQTHQTSRRCFGHLKVLRRVGVATRGNTGSRHLATRDPRPGAGRGADVSAPDA